MECVFRATWFLRFKGIIMLPVNITADGVKVFIGGYVWLRREEPDDHILEGPFRVIAFWIRVYEKPNQTPSNYIGREYYVGLSNGDIVQAKYTLSQQGSHGFLPFNRRIVMKISKTISAKNTSIIFVILVLFFMVTSLQAIDFDDFNRNSPSISKPSKNFPDDLSIKCFGSFCFMYDSIIREGNLVAIFFFKDTSTFPVYGGSMMMDCRDGRWVISHLCKIGPKYNIYDATKTNFEPRLLGVGTFGHELYLNICK